MTSLASVLFECPSDLMCGPCRQKIGALIEVAEAARGVADFHQSHTAWVEAGRRLDAALRSLDALLPDNAWNPDDLRSPDASCEEADLPAEERALLPDNDEARPA